MSGQAGNNADCKHETFVTYHAPGGRREIICRRCGKTREKIAAEHQVGSDDYYAGIARRLKEIESGG